uniref:Uncharacterized protein n=1 Tax=Anguilla anguilla TaxID=7936 RepID=A0A0E9RNK8_ANGAN
MYSHLIFDIFSPDASLTSVKTSWPVRSRGP